ncbi:MAG TPA: DUF3108 domain-containing protein [Candidatus Angelobacter sp.]|jgi:hypothetical protein|nr:DUF3108 domain-containing protein [Candidatus Angelobacter sp.]
MYSSVTFLVLVLCQTLVPVSQSHAPKTEAQPNGVGLPKPAMDLTTGTWKYKETYGMSSGTEHSTFSTTTKDDGGVWTVTSHWETSAGPVTDISTLDKGTLALRKESFKHFAKQGQPWKPVEINLDYTANKVTGTMKYESGQVKPVAVDVGGPLFADAPGWIGSLALADGYSTTFRTWDFEQFDKLNQKLLQLKVVGTERVTVPAGTFDSYKVEVTSDDSRSYKQTVWIAKGSRTPVKAYTVEAVGRGSISTTAELVP